MLRSKRPELLHTARHRLHRVTKRDAAECSLPSPFRYSSVSQSLGCFLLHSSFPLLRKTNQQTDDVSDNVIDNSNNKQIGDELFESADLLPPPVSSREICHRSSYGIDRFDLILGFLSSGCFISLRDLRSGFFLLFPPFHSIFLFFSFSFLFLLKFWFECHLLKFSRWDLMNAVVAYLRKYRTVTTAIMATRMTPATTAPAIMRT